MILHEQVFATPGRRHKEPFRAAGALLPLPWRDLFAPTAPNVAHVAFFAGLLAANRV